MNKGSPRLPVGVLWVGHSCPTICPHPLLRYRPQGREHIEPAGPRAPQLFASGILWRFCGESVCSIL